MKNIKSKKASISCIYPILGILYLKDKGLRKFIIIPMIINILLFLLVLAKIHSWVSYLTDYFSYSFVFIKWLLLPLFYAFFLIFIFFTFSILGNFIASPFNAYLAEYIQKKKYNYNSSFYWQDFILLIPRSIKRELQKILYWLTRFLLIFCLSFIPIINIITPLLFFLFTVYFTTLQYIDYASDNRKNNFSETINKIKLKKFGAVAFGITTLFITIIPFINFIVIPSAVIGGTLFWEDYLEKNH